MLQQLNQQNMISVGKLKKCTFLQQISVFSTFFFYFSINTYSARFWHLTSLPLLLLLTFLQLHAQKYPQKSSHSLMSRLHSWNTKLRYLNVHPNMSPPGWKACLWDIFPPFHHSASCLQPIWLLVQMWHFAFTYRLLLCLLWCNCWSDKQSKDCPIIQTIKFFPTATLLLNLQTSVRKHFFSFLFCAEIHQWFLTYQDFN